MAETIAFKLNDKPVHLEVDGRRPLLWVLRTVEVELLWGRLSACGRGVMAPISLRVIFMMGSRILFPNGLQRPALWKT